MLPGILWWYNREIWLKNVTGKFSEALNKNKRIFLECDHGNYVNPEKIERKACGKGRNTIK